ncbi:hypothetical protein [Deinococcus ruber]|uniref:Uncharacterized protein n=1 Tax=Deinococcus ruber TaxID=1848197 RepID=A0A918CCA6_9DEIO|nr:hypothetical protein [Deinococcus ruber]GGR16980.1 hypothetical protein GCM10008957_32030 [Deinococcus ruber]
MGRERVSRFVRTHTPFQPPKFTVWHGLGLLLLIGIFVFTQHAPGVMADLSGVIIGNPATSWQLAIYVRITIIVLALYALFGVRGLHWLMNIALPCAVVGFELRLGENRITHDPLTLGFGLVQLFCFLVVVRLITRQPDPPKEHA